MHKVGTSQIHHQYFFFTVFNDLGNSRYPTSGQHKFSLTVDFPLHNPNKTNFSHEIFSIIDARIGKRLLTSDWKIATLHSRRLSLHLLFTFNFNPIFFRGE